MRKGFFIDQSVVGTPVYDAISKFVPDQSLPLREMLLQFSYLSGEKIGEIINRGFDGDEDDEFLLGVDASQLDFSEIHDRLIELIPKERKKVAAHETEPEQENEPESASEISE